MKTKKTNWNKIIATIIFACGILYGGMVIGMAYQQVLFYNGLATVLSYTDIEMNFDLNETKFVEEFNKTIVPTLISERDYSKDMCMEKWEEHMCLLEDG